MCNSASPRPAKNPRREEDDRLYEFEHATHRDADKSKRQERKLDERVEDEGERPTHDEQHTPAGTS
jgi:hypothetical protein